MEGKAPQREVSEVPWLSRGLGVKLYGKGPNSAPLFLGRRPEVQQWAAKLPADLGLHMIGDREGEIATGDGKGTG